jgi:rhodanese-related sulfurtransferase
MISQLNPADFPGWRDGAAANDSLPVVLDVREPWELQTASVRADGFTLLHIPMRDVPAQLAELQQAHAPDQPIACLCHHGMRSLQVATYLAQNGFTKVVNLQGGIDAWSQQVDPSVPAY